QGFPTCSEVFCSVGSTYYGAGVGGFCCPGTQTGGNLGSCNTPVCSLDPAQPQGAPACPAPNFGNCAPGSSLYGWPSGGFCCQGNAHDGMCDSGIICAIDPNRTQGFPSCGFSLCPPNSTYYGAGVGGLCCPGSQTGGNLGTCSVNACSLDATQTHGVGVCK